MQDDRKWFAVDRRGHKVDESAWRNLQVEELSPLWCIDRLSVTIDCSLEAPSTTQNNEGVLDIVGVSGNGP